MGNLCRRTSTTDETSSEVISPQSISVKQDINSASVEALAESRGIGKILALRIVEFRDENGPFESMDGLLSVSGVGYSKLQALQEKFDVVSSLRGKIIKLDVNTATAQQLQSVEAISEPLAKMIIEHRENYGVFNSIDELGNIQDITQTEVATLGDYLEVRSVKKDEKHTKSGKGDGKDKKRPVMRIGSWNLERFSSEKASNEGVLEVICTTILKYRLSLVAFQELADENALQKVCDQLNSPTIDAISCLDNSRQWQCVTSGVTGRMFKSSEYNGFLWDTFHNISLHSSDILRGANKNKPFVRQPFIGYFKVKWDYSSVNVVPLFSAQFLPKYTSYMCSA